MDFESAEDRRVFGLVVCGIAVIVLFISASTICSGSRSRSRTRSRHDAALDLPIYTTDASNNGTRPPTIQNNIASGNMGTYPALNVPEPAHVKGRAWHASVPPPTYTAACADMTHHERRG